MCTITRSRSSSTQSLSPLPSSPSGLSALLFDFFANLIQHRVDLAIGSTGGDDHVVSDALLVANIDDLDILRLDVFQGSHGQLDQVVTFQRLVGVDRLWQRGALECAFALYFGLVFVSHIKLVLLMYSAAWRHGDPYQ